MDVGELSRVVDQTGRGGKRVSELCEGRDDGGSAA